MASGKMARCVWLIEMLRGRRMDHEELNRRWVNNHINDDGEELSKCSLNRHIETAEEFFGITIKCDRHCGYVYYIDCENHHRAGADALMCAKLFLREVKDAGWAALDEMPWCEGKL